MRKHVKSFVPFLLCLALFVSLFVPSAFATDTKPSPQEEHSARQPDYSRKGSITVYIHLGDESKTPVPGGTLTAYLVAPAREDNGNNDFVYVEPFGTGIVDPGTINNAEAGAPELAAELAAKAGAGGKTVTVDGNGKAVFTDLTLGLYLIVQDKPAPGYDSIRSFLVTVPMWDGEKLVYDVIANPKPDVAHEKAKVSIDLKAVKEVKVLSGTPAAETFVFTLKPVEYKSKVGPMPENATLNKDGSMTVKRTGAGTVSFGTIYFTADDVGEYVYEVKEIPGSTSNYTYDSRTYLIAVRVTSDPTTGVKAEVGYVLGNKKVSEIRFVNIYQTRIPWNPPRRTLLYMLPQTGHRTWLVSVLAGLGLGLFLLGWCLRRKGEGDS